MTPHTSPQSDAQSDSRLTLDDAMKRLKLATVSRYAHGGARVYYEDIEGNRELIMDIYGDGRYRDLILGLIAGCAR